MKKLFFLLSAIFLISCSKNHDGNMTISCAGDKVLRKKNENTWEHVKNIRYTNDYVFVNKELHPYDCSWSNRGITCLSNKSIDGMINVVIVIDRERGEVWESITINNKDGNATNEIFTGKCEKLVNKF